MIDLVSPDFWPIVPLVPHWGISHFIWRFMDPHGLARSSSLTGRSLRRGYDRYLIMVPQWSILGAIQLGPHFSVLSCHHASPSGRYVLDLRAWFNYGFGWSGLHVWWEMVSCHLFLWPITHPMPCWGIFPFRMRFTDLHGGHMFDDRWFHVTQSPTYHTFDAILGHITVLDEIYRSWWSCVLIPICETCAKTMIYSLSLRWFLSGASWELPR